MYARELAQAFLYKGHQGIFLSINLFVTPNPLPTIIELKLAYGVLVRNIKSNEVEIKSLYTVGQASDSTTALTYSFNRWVGA